MNELAEWLRRRDEACIEEHLVPEARVEQVEHRVLGAADVEIDGHPVLLELRVDQYIVVYGIDEAQKIPA